MIVFEDDFGSDDYYRYLMIYQVGVDRYFIREQVSDPSVEAGVACLFEDFEEALMHMFEFLEAKDEVP